MSEEDLWQRLKLRLKDLAYKQGDGCIQISVTLVVRERELLGWTTPETHTMEPYANREAIGKALLLDCEALDIQSKKL